MNLGLALRYLQIIAGEELLLSLYLCPLHYDMMFTAVFKFEIPCLGCEWEIL